MHCVWRICFLSTDQMHNKALWTSFLFKHGSWCVSFTCLSFCSCKMTSQTVEEKTLTNKLSLVPFLFSLSSLLSAVDITSFYSFFFCFLLQPTLILTDLSWCHKFLLLLMSPMPQIKETFIKMECFKTKPCPSQKQRTSVHGSNITIILLSHFAMYWIWSMLDPDERLLVTVISPPIFGSQHCFRFRNRMQLNMDGLRLKTLYNKLPFLFQI